MLTLDHASVDCRGMSRSSKENIKRLLELASLQESFFTARQAIDAGYVDAVHGYHVTHGNWERHFRGVYRLASLPEPDWKEPILACFWSRDRDDAPQAVISHESAAALHGILPRTQIIDVIVPPEFRKSAETPLFIRLRKATLAVEDIEERPGCRVTTLRRTLQDLTSHPDYERLLHEARSRQDFYAPAARAISDYNRVIEMGED